MLSEISPNGEEYFRFFRQECRRRGISIAAVETVSQSPDDLAANLDNLRQAGADALVYMGYGMLAAKGLLREALDKLGWDPPRIMGTSFMFYLMGFDKFEGWVGVDQFDPSNPLVERVPRAVRRALRRGPAVLAERDPGARLRHRTRARRRACSARRSSRARASRPASRRSASCRARPADARTHIACSPYEHGMFRGDWLLYGRVTDGKLEFEGLFEPWE